jgi:hypothetical protein
MHFTREKYRETRLQQYKNYENLDVAHKELEKVRADEELVLLGPYLPTALQSDSSKIPGQQVSSQERNGGVLDCMHEKAKLGLYGQDCGMALQKRLHQKSVDLLCDLWSHAFLSSLNAGKLLRQLCGGVRLYKE